MRSVSNVLLTIAIPTYNRAALLESTLESILPQVTDGIELLVCSNGSTDNTDETMRSYCGKYDYITYIKNSKNEGIDFNIHRCTKEAKGSFIHLMSDDDILLEGAIENLLNQIKINPDVKFFYLNHQNFSGKFNRNNLSEPTFPARNDIIFRDKTEFVRYIWIWATFLSSFVIHKETWNKIPKPEQYIGTHIYLSYMLFEHLNIDERAVFVAKPSIAVRAQYTGNYNIFYAFGYQWKRLLLEHAPALGYNKNIMKKIFSRTISEDLIFRLYDLKCKKISTSLSNQGLKFLIVSTCNTIGGWLYILPALIMPTYVLGKYIKLVNMKKRDLNHGRQ